MRRGRRSVTEPDIEEGSLRLIHLQDFLDLLNVLAGEPERFFNKAIKLLPGDSDLRAEFIDGESALFYITGQIKQKVFHIKARLSESSKQ